MFVDDREAVDRDARLTASSRASDTSRPALLVPSPQTSIVRREALNGLSASIRRARSMPALIAVRPQNDRGAAVSLVTNACADPGRGSPSSPAPS